MLMPVNYRAWSQYPLALALASLALALSPGCGPTAGDDLDQSQVDLDGDGYTSTLSGGEDCNDNNALVFPGSSETLNERDDDCDERIDESTEGYDDDGDGFTELEGDSNDSDPSIYPGALELEDSKDNDQDGLIDEGTDSADLDGDGYSLGDGDLDDSDPDTYPGADERIDGKDNDQDGNIDEGTTAFDDDNDGYNEDQGDCDDSDPARSPGALEACEAEGAQALDNDCDGQIDEGSVCVVDLDGDGSSQEDGDCDDQNSDIFPGQNELLNSIDDDCDEKIDEGTTAYDDDGDGFSEDEGDCNDNVGRIYPDAPEFSGGLPDGIDNDCDGNIDEGFATEDGDGDGSPEGEDCDNTNPTIYPGAPELADGQDNDCDGIADEATSAFDDDLDGYSENDGDCDDSDPTTYPGAEESCDGLDNDCSGAIDEPCQPCAIPEDYESVNEAVEGGCREIILNESLSEEISLTDPSTSVYLIGGIEGVEVDAVAITLSELSRESIRTIGVQNLGILGPVVIDNQDPSARVELRDVTMIEVTASPAPITASGYNISIQGSTFLGNQSGASANAAGAIRLMNTKNFEILGNRFESNIAPLYLDDIAGAVFLGGAHSYGAIENNLFFANSASGGNAGGAIFIEPEVQSEVLIRNNTFTFNLNLLSPDASSIRCQGSLSGGQLDSNIHWDEVGSHIKGCDLATLQYSTLQSLPLLSGEGNLSAAPLFLDNFDFLLAPASPAKDAGSPDETRRDLDGSRNDQGYTGGPGGSI